MQLKNKVVIASAGSGKTTTIVEEVLSINNSKIAILTYTINNLTEIKKKIYETGHTIPENVTIQTWFSFLVEECVRPYQNFVFERYRIESIFFVNNSSSLYIPKSNIEKYYFSGKNIFSDKLSEFSIECNLHSKGLVIQRLEQRFDRIYIDEIQDMAGYDLDFLELLFRSKIKITLVGDNRQATYSTNSSAKNKKYKGSKIINLFTIWERSGLCNLNFQSISYRCNQQICDLADSLFPEMPTTKSMSQSVSSHDGIFTIPNKLVDEYICKYSPMVLRYDRRTIWEGQNIMNFGEAKGLTFPHVLILPNSPIQHFLVSGDINDVRASREKLYVAITRAVHSVAFLHSKNVALPNVRQLLSLQSLT